MNISELNVYAPGIYQIRNINTGQIYIGSSANRSGMGGRFAQHRLALRRKSHSNSRLQNSWNKYGEDVFAFEVIEFCQKNLTILREQYYIDNLNPYYNILRIASSRLGSKFSPATIEKLKGRIPWNKGNLSLKKSKKMSKEELETSKILSDKKRSVAMLGRKKNIDVVERIAQKRRKPVIAININTAEQIKFCGVRRAAEALNLDVSMISKVCLGKYTRYKEWKFVYGS